MFKVVFSRILLFSVRVRVLLIRIIYRTLEDISVSNMFCIATTRIGAIFCYIW